MNHVRLGCLVGLLALQGLACSGGDEPDEPVVESRVEALAGGFPLAGYWEGLGGPFRFIEFTRRAVASPDPNSFLFVARVAVNGALFDFPGYYVEQSPTRVKLGPIGAVNPQLSRYFGTYATNYSASTLEFRQQNVANPVNAALRPTAVRVGASGLPLRIFLPAQPNAVDEFAAYELRKHLELVLGGQVRIYGEQPVIPNDGAYAGIYLGDTAFARSLRIYPSQFGDEEYTIQSAGRSIVLAGKATLPAAAPGNVHWGAPGEFAATFDTTKNEYGVEVSKGENLFSAAAGGTLELFLRDEAKCGPADRSQCGYGDAFLMLTPAPGLPSTFKVLLYHFDDGLHLTFELRKDDRRDMNATYALSPSPIVIPRDGQIHHVTLSFAPCTPAETSAICVTSWRDREGAGTATTVWNNLALPGTRRSNLDVSTTWDQQLDFNTHTSEVGSMFLGSLHGLRFASKSATAAEHRARTTASLRETPASTDRMVYPFSERSMPSDWAKTSRRVVPRVPSMWGQRGTLHAVYEFLERRFGVRWYMPGPLGTAYTPMSSVNLPAMSLSGVNSLRHRYAAPPNWLTPPHHVAFGSLGEAFTQRDRDAWSLRMRLGGEDIPVGHGYNNFSGVVSTNNSVAQPCYDDPSVIASVGASAEKFYTVDEAAYRTTAEGRNMPFARNGTFVMGAKDNKLFWGPGDCNYDAALARNRVDTSFPESQYFSGRASEYVWDHYNRVAAAAKTAATRSGRTSLITGLAYQDHTYPPTQPIADNVLPVVTFFIRNWQSPIGRDIVTAWARKQPSRGWMGWTYVNDAAYGAFPTPPFDAAALSAAARQAMADGISGMQFEHNSSYDQTNAIADRTTFATDIALYEAKPELRDNWPHSLSQLWQSIGGTMHCDGNDPTQGQTPDWTPYCERYNADAHATWARLAPVLVAAYVARGASYTMLENYVLMRTLADPTKSASTLISEHFTPFYGAAGAAMKSFYDAVAARPTELSFHAECGSEHPGSIAYYDCVWPRRFPKAFITELAGYVNTARAKLAAGELSDVEAKRVNAFLRTNWCIFVRGRYIHYDDAATMRSTDPLERAQVCGEDTTLKTFTTSATRFLLE